jgi:glycosyltransferase involved in cell wall biosynthesis
MIESMATGTPVIGMGLGAVPEVIAHGKTGFVCHSLEKMIEAIPAATKIDRKTCRDYVLNRFSVQSMADEYEKVFQLLIS